jgi:cob(I)alamin adenosyltransferase
LDNFFFFSKNVKFLCTKFNICARAQVCAAQKSKIVHVHSFVLHKAQNFVHYARALCARAEGLLVSQHIFADSIQSALKVS